MTQTIDGAFKLIENMVASSTNENHESNRSKKINSVDTQKIDELTAKVDQLLKTTKEKSSAWSKLWVGRFRTLKRLLLGLKRKETIRVTKFIKHIWVTSLWCDSCIISRACASFVAFCSVDG